MAQLGARLDGIEEVVASNPIGSTKFSPVYFLYILQSETSDRYYIGQTQDVSERLVYHNANYSKSLKEPRTLAARPHRAIQNTQRSHLSPILPVAELV